MIDINETEYPQILASKISVLLHDKLRNKEINLYSAFLLNQEFLKFERIAYTQPAWQHTLGITGLLNIYMQYLTALAFKESSVAETVKSWLVSDFKILGETRPHYFTSKLEEGVDGLLDKDWLEMLLSMRKKYKALSYNKGPYHNEVFPEDISPEAVLLGDKALPEFEDKTVNPDVEDLLVEIAISDWF